MSWLEKLGIHSVINATGPWTIMGNSALSPDVREAMDEMAQTFVPIDELQNAASRIISGITGSEGGYVTAGAASAITLSIAACVAKEDPERIWALPKIHNAPNTVVMFKQSRSYYDVAVRSVGVDLRIVDAFAEDAIDQLVAAIDSDVACVFHDYTGLPYRDRSGIPALSEVVEAAHRGGVPIIIDASMAVPPHTNLSDIVKTGADFVAFSGGKALQGPAASGFVACRSEFLRSIAIQHQDVDIWEEITGKVDNDKKFMGIGRSHKVGKEQIVGMLVALQAYSERDHAETLAFWESSLQLIENAIEDIAGVATRWEVAGDGRAPYLMVSFDGSQSALTPAAVSASLMKSAPRVFIAAHWNNAIWIGPETLQEGEASIVAEQLRAAIISSSA
jgi:uncharacterized pyridoxal phosphate-dependent enzyme